MIAQMAAEPKTEAYVDNAGIGQPAASISESMPQAICLGDGAQASLMLYAHRGHAPAQAECHHQLGGLLFPPESTGACRVRIRVPVPVRVRVEHVFINKHMLLANKHTISNTQPTATQMGGRSSPGAPMRPRTGQIPVANGERCRLRVIERRPPSLSASRCFKKISTGNMAG